MNKIPFQFNMSRNQLILGRCYFPVHVLVLPLLISYYASFINPEADLSRLNLAYFTVGFFLILAFMRTYLRRDFDNLCDHFLHCIAILFAAYFLDAVLSLIASVAGEYILGGNSGSTPNNDAVSNMAGSNYGITMALAVFLAPMVEEVLFRGVVFGSIRRKNRILAYVVSVLLFSLYHVWQYAVGYMDPSMLLYMIYYIPVSIALAWCYDSTQSIWTPIFFHMFINFMSLQVLTAL